MSHVGKPQKKTGSTTIRIDWEFGLGTVNWACCLQVKWEQRRSNLFPLVMQPANPVLYPLDGLLV